MRAGSIDSSFKLLSYCKSGEIVCLCSVFVSQFALSLNQDYYTPSRVLSLFCLELMPSDEGALAIASAINFPVAGIAYNLILMRVVQHSAKPEEHTSTFIGNLTFESNKKTETDGTDPIPAELVV